MLTKVEKAISKSILTLHVNGVSLTGDEINQLIQLTMIHFEQTNHIVNEVIDCLYYKKYSVVKTSITLNICESQVKNYNKLFINRLAFELAKGLTKS